MLAGVPLLGTVRAALIKGRDGGDGKCLGSRGIVQECARGACVEVNHIANRFPSSALARSNIAAAVMCRLVTRMVC